jgi:Zinc finger, C2H2 type
MSYICEKCNKSFSEDKYLKQHKGKRNPCDKVHSCDKCSKIFKTSQSLRNHKNRKNPCVPNEVPVIDLTQDDNKCRFCGNNYSNKYNLRRHVDSCSMKNNQTAMLELVLEKLDEMKEENKVLRNQIQLQPVQQVTNVTNNTVVNNNLYVNVTICSFGKEDLNRLDTSKVMNLLKNHTSDFMPRMIEHVHANPDHPEFHNVFYDPEREKAIVFAPISETEMSWQTRDFKELSNALAAKIKDHIRPGAGPYFDIAMRDKDSETSNEIIKIVNQTDWGTDDVLEMNKESLTKVAKNKAFRDMVKIAE